jgi:hippurate hydrolase
VTYLLQALQARAGEFISLRRDIHRHPELAFEEHRTAALVADKLEGWGYAVERGLGGTGVVGTLVRGRGTRRLGLRADMDALPIAEATAPSGRAGRPASCTPAATTATPRCCWPRRATWPSRVRFDGTLHLIFQPAEEGGGGALRMMDDGLFERFPCDAVFAMHNMPGTRRAASCCAKARRWPRPTTPPSPSPARAATARCRTARPTRWWPRRAS